MSRFLSQRFASLKPYVPGEQPKDKRYIKLNTNEAPYPPSRKVEAVFSRQITDDLRLYSDPDCTALKEALAERYSVKPENLMLGNGSDEVLSFAFAAFCDGQNGISYPDISYGFYKVLAGYYGIPASVLPLDPDFRLLPEAFFDAGAMVVLANPNAPTGCCISLEDIKSIAQKNRDRVVLVDEAYIDFGGESAVPLIDTCENLLVVQTFSKSRALAGARLGYAIGSRELIADLEAVRCSTNPFNVNLLTMQAGLAALADEEYYDKNIAEIIRIRDNFVEKLEELGFISLPSCTNFVFTRHPNCGGELLYLQLKQRGILVRHFPGARTGDYIRITIGFAEQMEDLLSAIREILKNA